MKRPVAEELKRFVETAGRDPSVFAVMLFGSHARGEETAGSDVDVCLIFLPKAQENLALSQKKHEYTTAFDLDVQVFRQLPLYMRHRVLRDGKVLFCRDEPLLYELAYRTVQEYEDFRHRHEAYLEEVARG
jgi:hypothetical protein